VSRFARRVMPTKAPTAADRKFAMYHFLGFARPDKVAAHTPESLAAAYQVKIEVAREALQKFGRLV